MEQTERQLVSLLSEITSLYDVPMREAKARQDALAKPPGSLGLLEDLSVQLAGITGQVKNEVSHTRIYVLAADNGVVCEGVSSAPQSVTRAQAINLTRGLTGASCLAKHFGDELVHSFSTCWVDMRDTSMPSTDVPGKATWEYSTPAATQQPA